jgi:hypothetical protein
MRLIGRALLRRLNDAVLERKQPSVTARTDRRERSDSFAEPGRWRCHVGARCDADRWRIRRGLRPDTFPKLCLGVGRPLPKPTADAVGCKRTSAVNYRRSRLVLGFVGDLDGAFVEADSRRMVPRRNPRSRHYAHHGPGRLLRSSPRPRLTAAAGTDRNSSLRNPRDASGVLCGSEKRLCPEKE